MMPLHNGISAIGGGWAARQGLMVNPCEHCLLRLLVASDLSQPFVCDLLETVEQCSGSANIFQLFGKPFGFLFWCTRFPVHGYLTSFRDSENYLSGAPLRSDIRRIPRPPKRVKETAAGGTRRACP